MVMGVNQIMEKKETHKCKGDQSNNQEKTKHVEVTDLEIGHFSTL